MTCCDERRLVDHVGELCARKARRERRQPLRHLVRVGVRARGRVRVGFRIRVRIRVRVSVSVRVSVRGRGRGRGRGRVQPLRHLVELEALLILDLG